MRNCTTTDLRFLPRGVYLQLFPLSCCRVYPRSSTVMMPSATHTAVLACRPGTQSRAVRGIEARLSWGQDGALVLTYALKGDLSRLRIAPPGPPPRADHLWQYTCEGAVSTNAFIVALPGGRFPYSSNIEVSRSLAP